MSHEARNHPLQGCWKWLMVWEFKQTLSLLPLMPHQDVRAEAQDMHPKVGVV